MNGLDRAIMRGGLRRVQHDTLLLRALTLPRLPGERYGRGIPLETFYLGTHHPKWRSHCTWKG